MLVKLEKVKISRVTEVAKELAKRETEKGNVERERIRLKSSY